MKTLRIFILVLLSSSITAQACGFYPFGEDLRFCFFRPEYYGYTTFSEFDYSSDSFYDKDIFDENDIPPNDKAWFDYCKGKVSVNSIRNAVYELGDRSLDTLSDNEMVKYLFAVKDMEAINYLKFAKQCEEVNTFYSDPWERNDYAEVPIRNKFINLAIDKAKETKNPLIQQRYAFLAIRLAYYSGRVDVINQLYDEYFANSNNKNIIYYWSLYFKAITESDEALASFNAAQVFKHAPDKRFVVYTSFSRNIPIQEILQYAKTKEERANVYLLSGIRRPDKAFEEIKGVYNNEPNSEGLDFLLLREVNKIEDWIYTPYYSLFTPSVFTGYDENFDESAAVVLSRVEADRKYARKLLDFINAVNLKKVNNPQFWQMVKAQLEFITKNYNSCLSTIKKIEKTKGLSEPQLKQLSKVKVLAITALQPYGNAIVKNEIKDIVIQNKDDSHFLFAIGRELEYKGNTTDAALFYSKLDENYGSYYGSSVFWKSKKRAGETYYDYYSEWFGYLNFVYTPEQMKSVINSVENNKDSDAFSEWLHSNLKEELPRLHDLLGTKYIRQNKLQLALEQFKLPGDGYWLENYSPWERSDNWGNVFDANPFYDIKYTPAFIPVKDTIKANKYTVTRQLIKYLAKAEDVKEKDRDYYYFLVGNCYYNMTWYGNAWMMRRYNWSTGANLNIVEDNEEYYSCNLAKHYYNLAYKNAKTDKFKALCLRMAGRCERNGYTYKHLVNYYNNRQENNQEEVNPYYERLEEKYPDYYFDLTSDCTFFEDYFKARR